MWRDLTVGRIWTAESEVKEEHYPSSQIWKNWGISESQKKKEKKKRDGEKSEGKLTCSAVYCSDQQETTVRFGNAVCWEQSMQILILQYSYM